MKATVFKHLKRFPVKREAAHSIVPEGIARSLEIIKIVRIVMTTTLNAFYMSGTVLNVFLFNLHLWDGHYYYPHFTDEEAEA